MADYHSEGLGLNLFIQGLICVRQSFFLMSFNTPSRNKLVFQVMKICESKHLSYHQNVPYIFVRRLTVPLQILAIMYNGGDTHSNSEGAEISVWANTLVPDIMTALPVTVLKPS